MAAAAAWGKLQASCKVCRRSDSVELRKAWGCDADAPAPIFEDDCVRCGGSDPDCGRCDGHGTERALRCPFAVVTNISARIIDYVGVVEAGFLPVEGGWEDQSATFTRAVRFAAGKKAEWMAAHAEGGR